MVIPLAVVAGLAAGSVGTIAVQGGPDGETPATVTTMARTTTTTAPPAIATDPSPPPVASTEPGPPADVVLLVWTSGGLPAGFPEAVAALPGVTGTTLVRADVAGLTASYDATGLPVDRVEPGYVIPVEVMAFDPATYPFFLPKEAVALFTSLRPGEALLGETSARLRAIGRGGSLEFADGTVLTVAGIVDDVLIGAAEAAVIQGGESGGGVTDRYLLVRHSGERKQVESLIRGALPAGLEVRIRAPGETPVLRHGDAVLPQVAIKDRFGEFAYRADGDGRAFTQDEEWVIAHIVTADLPIVGTVHCHRSVMPFLEGALRELADRSLAFLVDRSGFRGCHSARFIGGGRGISRHAWGVAVDLNFGANPEGTSAAQDPRLIEVMERWGFTSGHDWLVPDPGHFEFVRDPTP